MRAHVEGCAGHYILREYTQCGMGLILGGESCRNTAFYAIREADVVVIEFVKTILARTSILDPSHVH